MTVRGVRGVPEVPTTSDGAGGPQDLVQGHAELAAAMMAEVILYLEKAAAGSVDDCISDCAELKKCLLMILAGNGGLYPVDRPLRAALAYGVAGERIRMQLPILAIRRALSGEK